VNQPQPGQRRQDPDSGAQVSQGPSGDIGAEGLGGADAVPDTPDMNFAEDADDRRPDRRGAALDESSLSDEDRPDT
jgi:hypothetical protein